MTRWLLGLILVALGFSIGLNVGQWREATTVARLTTTLWDESRMRNHIAEEALNLLAESKYQITAAKAEAARRLRNKEDGRVGR